MTRQERSAFEFGVFRLDLAEHRLLREGRPVPLTPRVFGLLRVLVQNAGHLVEKEQLLKEVWADSFVEEGNLNRGISVLRKALGESSSGEKYIETVPKVGYRFIAPVREPDSKGPSADGDARVAGTRGGFRSMRAAGIGAGALLILVTIAFGVVRRSDPTGHAPTPGASVHRQLTFSGRDVTPTLSPEGTRIAYVSNESPQRKVLVQELAGGQPSVVFSAPEAGWLRWSPDGSEIMFWARGEGRDGLYIAPVSGGRARKIAEGPFVACWSPDGSTIAIARFQVGSIALLNPWGQEQGSIALRGTRGWIGDLDWSPANGRLLFVANDDQGRSAIWTIRADGRDQTKVFTANSEIPAARWSPAGDAVYYFGRVNQTLSLYKVFVRPDQQSAELAGTPLISGLETDGSFAISADGSRLVYARSPYYSNLWVVEAVDPAGGQEVRSTQLTHGTSLVERPRVSPNGKSIVFNMGYESRAELYTIAASGGAATRLTFLDSFSVGGTWSADGSAVAFASTKDGRARVWVVNADGSSPRPLSTGDMSDTTFDVTWSPGRQLLYQQAGNRNFYVLDPLTQQERLLIPNSSVGWAASPAYSPDGKTIALSWNRRPDQGVWIVDTSSSRQELAHKAVNPSDSNPWPIGWSADGRSIYAVDGIRAASRGVSVSTGETLTRAKILRLPVDDGPPTIVLPLPFEEIGSVAMFPDGRRFVCAVYSSRSDVWVVENFDGSAAPRLARAGR